MDLMVLPSAEDVILQLCDSITTLCFVSSGDDQTHGVRARPCEYELIDQAAAYGIPKSTGNVSVPYIYQ